MKFNITSKRLTESLGLMGVGVYVLSPQWLAPYIAAVFVLAGFGVLVPGLEFRNGQVATAPLGPRLKKMWPIFLMIGCAVGFVVGLVAYLRPTSEPRGVQAEGYGVVTPAPPKLIKPPKEARPATPRPSIVHAPSAATPKEASELNQRTLSAVSKPVASITMKVIRAPVEIGPDKKDDVPANAPAAQPKQEQPAFVEPTVYSSLSNEKLREKVHQFSDKLRGLEQRYHERQLQISSLPLTAQDGQQDVIELRRNMLTALREEKQKLFQDRYLADARDLHLEIVRRAARKHGSATQPQGPWGEGLHALDTGILGVHEPLAELATFFETWVKDI
jgi:hypothetical protein